MMKAHKSLADDSAIIAESKLADSPWRKGANFNPSYAETERVNVWGPAIHWDFDKASMHSWAPILTLISFILNMN